MSATNVSTPRSEARETSSGAVFRTRLPVRAVHPSPPAIWSAFARQAQWKNWVMLGQLVLIALLILTCLSIAKAEPDIVVVDSTGKSHYVRKTAASQALIRFLAEQKSQPSDLTVVSFTERFAQLFFAPNSSTVRAEVAQALAMMDAKLEAATQDALKRDKMVEKLEALKIRTELSIDALDELEHTGDLTHLRVKLSRTVSSLLDSSNPKSDSLVVELVERVVPRTEKHPDGLEVAEMVVGAPQPPNGSTAAGTGAGAGGGTVAGAGQIPALPSSPMMGAAQ